MFEDVFNCFDLPIRCHSRQEMAIAMTPPRVSPGQTPIHSPGQTPPGHTPPGQRLRQTGAAILGGGLGPKWAFGEVC